ncbi:MAG: NAD(P)H-hydrate epimerase [Lewinellaceae bacterium]|nr:NAD(P)H-hydrate epimerase [Phaeodactylibacter sp.]MCB9037612.1 NAD(P)H-hydrate epimerase [Lewinellaceae bacterium]
MSSIRVFRDALPAIDVPQMAEVDRLMIEEYHISLLQMMENAGRCLAVLARDRFLEGNPSGKRMMILAGSGGNGGGALVCARRLHGWGAEVEVYTSTPREQMKPASVHQLDILERMGISVRSGAELGATRGFDLIIDGLIGYNLTGDPQGLSKSMIEWANKSPIPTLSLDTPSGLDLTSGKIHNPSIKARATLTLALPKKGLYAEDVLHLRGELYLGDIGVPPALYEEPSLEMKTGPIFCESDVLRLE